MSIDVRNLPQLSENQAPVKDPATLEQRVEALKSLESDFDMEATPTIIPHGCSVQLANAYTYHKKVG